MRVHAVDGPQDARLSVTTGYDAIAAEYDAQVRGDDWMRRVLHTHYARAFRPGQRVLDVGCGTGIDAIALARLGVRVVGVDGSAAMIAQLHAKVASEHLENLIRAQVLRIQDLANLLPEVVTPSTHTDPSRGFAAAVAPEGTPRGKPIDPRDAIGGLTDAAPFDGIISA